MRPAHGFFAVFLVIAGLLLPCAAALPVDDVSGVLRTQGAVELQGQTSLLTDTGVLHLRESFRAQDLSFNLNAEQLDVHYTWQDRYEPETPIGNPLQFRNNTGEEYLTVQNVFLRGSLNKLGEPEVLTVLDGGQGDLNMEARGTVTTSMSEQHYVTRAEWRDEDNVIGPQHGFWYLVGPGLKLGGFDEATVTGNFTLFLNNVTLSGTADGESWSHWTGYREEAAGPGVRHVESRITVIDVTQGELWVSTRGLLSVYATKGQVRVDGSVSAPTARGQLLEPAYTLTFNSAPLAMSGSGSVVVERDSQGGQGGGFHDLPGASGLLVSPSGRFAVERTAGLVVQPRAADGSWLSVLVWTPLVGLLFATGAVVVRQRHRLRRRWAKRRLDRQKAVEFQWLAIADSLLDAHQYEDAVRWYEKIARKIPHSSLAWNSMAYALEALEEWGRAAEAYEKTHRMSAHGTDGTFLAAAVQNAWKAGQAERAVSLLLELITLDAALARGQFDRTGFKDLWNHSQIKAAWGTDDEGHGPAYV